MNQKKEAEIWMDKIAQEEADREYKKEQEKWMEEDQKRIQLLKDVYKGREDALKYQKQLKEEEKNSIANDRKVLDEVLFVHRFFVDILFPIIVQLFLHKEHLVFLFFLNHLFLLFDIIIDFDVVFSLRLLPF